MTPLYAGGVEVAHMVRSGFVEGRHRGSVAVLDAEGETLATVGDPRGAIFPRSSNKPMQAVAMLRCGLRVDPADLAVISASHSAEPVHVDRIRAMLRAGDLTETHLRCPPDLPLSEPARAAVLRAGGEPARIFMNCSGKHTGMLLTCRAAGWPVEDYVAFDHPLQKACREAVEDLSGDSVAAIGVDGCGAPVMAISLLGLARAFLRLVCAAEATPQRQVADAMRAHPDLVSGTGRADQLLMRRVDGLLAKSGAEGVIAAAAPGVGAAAVKIDDGAGRACLPVLLRALGVLGLDSAALDDLRETAVLGGGEVVGSVRALEWPTSR